MLDLAYDNGYVPRRHVATATAYIATHRSKAAADTYTDRASKEQEHTQHDTHTHTHHIHTSHTHSHTHTHTHTLTTHTHTTHIDTSTLLQWVFPGGRHGPHRKYQKGNTNIHVNNATTRRE